MAFGHHHRNIWHLSIKKYGPLVDFDKKISSTKRRGGISGQHITIAISQSSMTKMKKIQIRLNKWDYFVISYLGMRRNVKSHAFIYGHCRDRKTFEKRIDMNLKVTLNFDVRQRCGAAPKRIHVGGECFNNLEWNHRQSVAVLLTWEFASQKMTWIHILQRLHQSTCEGGVSVIYFFNVDMEREKRSFVFSASF